MSKIKLPTELTSLLKKRSAIKEEIEQLEAAIILLEGNWLRKHGYMVPNLQEKKMFTN